MPAERVSLRRVREILRLKHERGASVRTIAVAIGVARSTVQLCLARAAAVGLAWSLPATLTDGGLESRPHPEQGFRACLGNPRLLRSYGRDRVEAACARGLEIGARSYGSVQSILQHGLDRQPAAAPSRPGELPLVHPNTRDSPLLPLRTTALLTHPMLDQLRQLGLAGMARAFEELATSPRGAELDHAERLGLLLHCELADRQDRRLRARLRYAQLRHQATVEDVDYRTSRGLDRALFQKLALGGWIEERHNLVIEGPTGVGNS